MDTEDNQKCLQFLDLNITNNKGTYEYKVYRNNAINNVQVKPQINFLISCFTENGYDSQQMKEIVRSFEEKRSTNRTPVADNDESSKIITLPWIPG